MTLNTSRTAVVGSSALGFVPLPAEVIRHRLVGRTFGLHNDARRPLRRRAAAETLVRPADETLRHKNRIEPVRQPDDPPSEVFRTPAARNLHAERHPAEQPFGNLGKALRAGESEIIEVQVVARNDNGYFAVTLREAPRVGFDVEKSVGNRLEEQVGRKPDAARTDRTLHPVVGRREDTDRPHEGLRAQLLQLFGGEVTVSDPDGLQGPDPFREHQIVAFSERIRPFEDR